MVGATPVNEPDHHTLRHTLLARLLDQTAEEVGRLSWAVNELLFILDDRAGELHLTRHERWSISRAREIADAVLGW